MSIAYRYLGNTGVKVSELCLGTMTFGREASEPESFRMLDRFIDAGGNFIDTADVYAGGESERILGRWLKGKVRDQFVIATKARFATGTGPNDVGLSRKHLFQAVQASLKRLGTDYIDLYQVHAWDPFTPLEDVLETLALLVQKGWIRYAGASNFRGWQLQKALDLSRQLHVTAFRCLQPQYNLLTRAPEWELLPICRNEGLGVIPWSPLRGGWLSGKYRRDMTELPSESRVAVAEKKGWGESWSRYNNDTTWAIVETVAQVAQEEGKSPAQVAINWLLQQPGITAPIIGARNLEQLENNLGASGWSLSAEHLTRLDAVSRPPVSYPYDDAAERQQRMGR
jgi:aryl-alcohol dehydrogenase-like predicted oxidoreductase